MLLLHPFVCAGDARDLAKGAKMQGSPVPLHLLPEPAGLGRLAPRRGEAIETAAQSLQYTPCNPSPIRRRGRHAMWVRQCELGAQSEFPLPSPSRLASNEAFIPPSQTPAPPRDETRLME